MSTNPSSFCWWELVIAVAGLVVSAVMLPTAIIESRRFAAWVAAVCFAVFSILAAVCFWKLWSA